MTHIGLIISRLGDLDLWAFNPETGEQYCPWDGQPSYQFQCFWDFSFLTYGATSVIRTMWHRDLELWPWNWCALLPVVWATFLPILVFLERFVLYFSANTCKMRHMTLQPWSLMTLEVTALVDDVALHARSLYWVWSSYFRRYCAFTMWALIGLMILTFWPLNLQFKIPPPLLGRGHNKDKMTWGMQCNPVFVHPQVLLQPALQPQDTKLSMLSADIFISSNRDDQNVVPKASSLFCWIQLIWFPFRCYTVRKVLNEFCAASVLVGGSDSDFNENESDNRLD